jgi:hypothetical protein
MSTKTGNSGAELFKGVLLAHVIIGLHVGVIALIGLLVIFFGGIARYWGWILLGGLTAAGLFGVFLYHKVKSRGRDIYRDIRSAPVMPGGTLEVSLLGGLASVKFSKPADAPALPPAARILDDLDHGLLELDRPVIAREQHGPLDPVFSLCKRYPLGHQRLRLHPVLLWIRRAPFLDIFRPMPG